MIPFIIILSLLQNIVDSSISSSDNNDNTLSACKMHQYTKGKWELKPGDSPTKKTTKSFYCCGWEDNDYESNISICGAERLTDSFNYLIHGHTTKEPSRHAGGHACFCDRDEGRLTVNRREKYEWIPSSCHWMSWNSKHFCQALGNRTLLLVGDSTVSQSASTLFNMIRSGGEDCAHQISFGRSDFLAYVIRGRGDKSFLDFVRMATPDIVIFSAGPHLVDKDDISSTWEQMKPIITTLKTEYPNLRFAWKSQNPGHLNCGDYHAPTNESYEEIMSHPVRHRGMKRYNWDFNPFYDSCSRDYCEMLNVTYIDMSPLYFRPDAHPAQGNDCLHYCLPGPLDIFPQILLNLLHNKEL